MLKIVILNILKAIRKAIKKEHGWLLKFFSVIEINNYLFIYFGKIARNCSKVASKVIL